MRRSVRRAALVAVALCAGCRCGHERRPEPAALVGADATVVAVAPSLKQLAKRAGTLQQGLAGLALGEQLTALRTDLTHQLGFDPLSTDALEKAGLDSAGGFAVALEEPSPQRPRGGGYAILPAGDEKALAATVERLARDRAGLASSTEVNRGGVKVRVLTRGPGQPPVFAYAFARGYLIVSALAECDQMVAVAAARADGQSLASSPRWATARARLGERDFVLVANQTVLEWEGVHLPLPLLTAGATLGPSAIAARFYVKLSEPNAAAAVLAMPGGTSELVQRLPTGWPLALRTGVDFGKALGQPEATYPAPFRALLAEARALVKSAGLDADAVLGNLVPGAALALSLQPDATLADVADARFDPSKANPFGAVRLAAVTRVKDAAAAKAQLAQLEAALPRMASKAVHTQSHGLDVTTAHYALGDGVAWAQRADLVALGGGGVDPASLLDETKPGAPASYPALGGVSGLALQADFTALAALVGALPPSSFGTGPTSFVLRSTVEVAVQPLAPWRLSLALAPAPGGLALDADASFTPPPPAPGPK